MEQKHLFRTAIVLLSVVEGVKIVLCLGHAVSGGWALLPGLAGVSSTLDVELGVVLKDSGLGHVLLVLFVLLGGIAGTDLLVLLGGQASGDVRVGSDGSNLQL